VAGEAAEVQAIPAQKDIGKILKPYESALLIEEAEQEGLDGRHNDEETNQDEGWGNKDYGLKPLPNSNAHNRPF